jgi:hypothetical protein
MLRRQHSLGGLHEPFGYPDGLNAYTVEPNSPVSRVDPSGLKIIILLDTGKAAEEQSKNVTWEQYFDRLAQKWNDNLHQLLAALPRITAKKCTLNGGDTDLKALISALQAAEMEIRILDKNPNKAVQQIQQAAIDAGPDGEISIETHSSIDEDDSDFPPVLIGDQYYRLNELGELLGQLPTKVTLGTCVLTQKGVDTLAADLDTAVGGTGEYSHSVIGATPGGKLNPKGDVCNVSMLGPFGGAKLHGGAVPGAGRPGAKRPTD